MGWKRRNRTALGRLRRLGARGGDERGFSIVELLVALTVFAILITAVATISFNGLDLSRQNRNRTVAANLVSQEMDALRARDFTTLPIGFSSFSQPVDNVPFTVNRELTWVSSTATAGPCDAQNGAPQLLRVRVFVQWPEMRGVPPAEANTVLTPPVGSYDPNTGHVAVKVLNRDAEPAIAHPVTVTRTGFSQTLATNSEGCAFFAFLSANTYTVSLNSAGYVDRQGVTNPSQVVGVTVGTTSSVQFDYDQAATYQLTLNAPNGGTIASSVGLTLANTNFLPDGTKPFAGTGLTRTISGLFPSADGFSAWAGTCADADPEGTNAGGAEAYWPDGVRPDPLPATPGGTTTGTVDLASADVTVTRAGLPLAGVTVRAVHASDHVCASGEDLTIGTTNASGQLRVALPFGKEWEIRVTGYSPSGSWPKVELDPTSSTVPSASVVVL